MESKSNKGEKSTLAKKKESESTSKATCGQCDRTLRKKHDIVSMRCGHTFHLSCFILHSEPRGTTCLKCVIPQIILDPLAKGWYVTPADFGNDSTVSDINSVRYTLGEMTGKDRLDIDRISSTINNANQRASKSQIKRRAVYPPVVANLVGKAGYVFGKDDKDVSKSNSSSNNSNNNNDDNDDEEDEETEEEEEEGEGEDDKGVQDYSEKLERGSKFDYASAIRRGAKIDVLIKLGLNSVTAIIHKLNILDFVRNGYTFNHLLAIGVTWDDAVQLGLSTVDVFNECKFVITVELMVKFWNINYSDLISDVCNGKGVLFLKLDLTLQEVKLLQTSLKGLARKKVREIDINEYRVVKLNEWSQVCPKEDWPF